MAEGRETSGIVNQWVMSDTRHDPVVWKAGSVEATIPHPTDSDNELPDGTDCLLRERSAVFAIPVDSSADGGTGCVVMAFDRGANGLQLRSVLVLDVELTDPHDLADLHTLMLRPGGEGLSTRRLRMRFGGMQSRVRSFLARTDGIAQFRGGDAWRSAAMATPGLADGDHLALRLARLAHRYVELTNAGVPAVNTVLAAESADGASAKTVANRLGKARSLGLLTRPGHGKVGGELTDKAREILRKADDGAH